jgi:hypothetical protein
VHLIRAFITDETTGGSSNSPAVLAAIVIANEIRGLFVAIEGARMMGLL